MSADHRTPRFNSDAGGEDGRDALHPTADLAPDLVELALQLGDDAAFLAARYPASQFASAQAAVAPPPRDAQWRRWARRFSPVAAVFLLAVGIGLLATNHLAKIPLATESLKKQPGILTNQPDRHLELAAGRGDHSSSTEIPLEDGGPGVAQRRPGNMLESKALAADGGEIEVPNTQGVEEVGFRAPPAASRMARDELSMLRTQLMAFEKVIKRLQLELERRDELQARTEAHLQELTEEVAKLRGIKSDAPKLHDEP
jgi:hypothetical protein